MPEAACPRCLLFAFGDIKSFCHDDTDFKGMIIYWFFPILALYSNELASSYLIVCFIDKEQYVRL